ncbi:hypothetical protein MSj_02563 [Microcystis aeruginosa Sj]|uniref:Uncharacterized protein n=1 Tax=Microcystis aeruginosa Sj TaxID=1979544 RepID=A0A2Z6UMY3_MICAE|nr:hypothetical protein [Microcystis aeruginosa]GBL11065.1 hypothetical protein MSj_02563 [Microcystis aeruginosa Sj]
MSFSIRVPSLITPVYCIRQTEEPVFFILAALMPSADGDVPQPSYLRNGDYYYADEEEYRVFIVDRWIEAEEQLTKKYHRKASYIKKTYALIGMAAILFGFNIFINTICGNP